MKMLKFSTIVMGLALFGFSGCGSSDSTGTGDGGANTKLYGLVPGPYCYKITSIAQGYADTCGLAVEEFVGFSLPGTYDDAKGIFTLGNDGSLGGGPIVNNVGNLVRQGQSSNPQVPACIWNQTDNTTITMTDTNKFTAAVTETKTEITAACNESFTTCTSTWTWTFEADATKTIAAGCK